MRGRTTLQDAWRFRLLLDEDGNSFSGRFRLLLASNSVCDAAVCFCHARCRWNIRRARNV